MTASPPKKVLVICPYPVGVAPSQRLKYEQYFDSWRAHGYDITVSPFMTLPFWRLVYRPGRFVRKALWTAWGYLRRLYDLGRVPFYDVVYVHLWVVPFGPAVLEYLYCLLSPRVVYDIDDMVHLRDKQMSRSNPLLHLFKLRSRVFCLLKRARHVITCTPALDALARRFNASTTDISSTIDTDVYLPANPYSNARPLVLGWSGSHSTSRFLHLLDDVLRDLKKELDFRLVVIGDPTFRIDGLELTALPWRRETEVEDLRQIDVGLYPLPDDDWVQGKSGLKALQYMALGIPTVATAVGANFRVIEDGVSGFLVTTAEEWKDRIRRLAAGPELRRRVGAKARERVEAHFSVRANRGVYLGILDAVTATAPRGGDVAAPRARPGPGGRVPSP